MACLTTRELQTDSQLEQQTDREVKENHLEVVCHPLHVSLAGLYGLLDRPRGAAQLPLVGLLKRHQLHK